MSFDARCIRPSLRAQGRVARFLNPGFTERSFRLADRFMSRFLKGVWLGRHTSLEQRSIPRADGSPLRVCLCRAKAGVVPNATGLLWLHGGGFALGLPEQDYPFIDRFCADGSCVAVSPDYRRSTHAPYPAAVEDCYTALLWMQEHAAELGIRPDQLFVGGDSAGGGLCVAVCLCARDRGGPAVAYQMPLYPMLDDRMDSAGARDNDAPVWNSRSNKAAWELYLRGVENVPAYAAPARAESLAGLPPACTYVGDIEPFYNETETFVRRLEEAGVPVDHRVFPGCFHAFDVMCPRSDAAREAVAFLIESFRHAQESYFAASHTIRR